MHAEHSRYMQAALSLARRHLGQTWPNPAVGAIVVKDGNIIGEGCTARSGRPHAETEALKMVGAKASGATLYVTLEPCAHQGQTPPCVDALIKAGIARVVVACRDPHEQVNGKGIERLKNAGIEVIEGIGAKEAAEINRGFFSVVTKKRPYIALKLATSLDEKITTGTGQQWITGEAARAHGHLLRSRYDAIATGIGTVLADDPLLTCRLPGMENKSPVRIVFDSGLRLPADSQLAKTAGDVPVWVITSPSSRRRPGSTSGSVLEQMGIKLLSNSPHDMDPGLRRDDNIKGNDEIDLPEAVQLLAKQGITRLLVEAGQKLSTAFLQSGLVDRIYWFRAPITVGNAGLPAFTPGFAPNLASWKTVEHIALPPDYLEIMECSPAS